MSKVLEVKNLSKSFKKYNSEWARIFSWFGLEVKPKEEHHILKNINFSVSKGEVVGIVGENGAGKSTLLKIITGTLKPSLGSVVVNGRISAILELGMGFNPDMTGRQNVYNTSKLMGYSQSEIDSVIQNIEDFSEIDEYFDQPIRTYSSGMQMRVAFSVATAFKPDILIIDEALSVGDAYFQQKSMRKIMEFRTLGVSILFVSHDASAIKMLCDSAVLIDNGHVIDVGNPKDIMNFYQNMIIKKSHQGDSDFKHEKKKTQHKKEIESASSHASTGEVELVNFSLKNENDEKINYIVSEHLLKICFKVKALKYLDDPHYGIIIRNKFGLSAFETNTYIMRQDTKSLNKDEITKIEFSFICNLSASDYSISIGIGNKGYDRDSFEEYLLFIQDIEMIKILENCNSIQFGGYTNLKPTVKIK